MPTKLLKLLNKERIMNKIDTEVLHKEIDLIQACITRMAQNSFLIKGWTISIVAVVMALADKANNPALLSAILLIPLISFWYLDAFFLRTERMYRQMYTWVLDKRRHGDGDMLYDLNPNRFKDKVDSRLMIMWSETLRWFYGVPVLIVIVIIIWQCLQSCCANWQSFSSNNRQPSSPKAQVIADPSQTNHSESAESPCPKTCCANKRTAPLNNLGADTSIKPILDQKMSVSQTNQAHNAIFGN